MYIHLSRQALGAVQMFTTGFGGLVVFNCKGIKNKLKTPFFAQLILLNRLLFDYIICFLAYKKSKYTHICKLR